MSPDPRAGKPAVPSMLTNIPRLMSAYYTISPDVAVPGQRVSFGTSGHRGSSFDATFNEQHILAITQAICSYRRAQRIDGPLFLGSMARCFSASTRMPCPTPHSALHSKCSRPMA
jgi:phosphoglucomutase